MTTEPLDLRFTPEVARRTADVLERVRRVVPEMEWPVHAPYVDAIREWKARRNAVVLAHNYQTPEIFHGVADVTGDSLALAQKGARTDADVIVMAGVHFMAETAKILSPGKTVLIPDLEAGCSLASSDHRRRRAPAARAVSGRSRGHLREHLGRSQGRVRRLLHLGERGGGSRVAERAAGDLLPDEYLGRYVASKTKTEIILWKGHCEVHERFTGDEIRTSSANTRTSPSSPTRSALRTCWPRRTTSLDRGHGPLPRRGPALAGRPRDRVLDGRQRGRRVPRDRVRPALQPLPAHEADHPAKILHALQAMEHRVEVDEAVAVRARRAVERMLAVGRGASR